MIWCVIWLGVASAQPRSPAPPAAANQADASAMRAVVRDQIAAFQRDDAAGAWRHVAPALRERFGTAERFLEMVRTYYRPVYAPRAYSFGAVERIDAGWGQWLDVVGPDGRAIRALYLLEQMPDGAWRTTGCLLFEPKPADPSV